MRQLFLLALMFTAVLPAFAKTGMETTEEESTEESAPTQSRSRVSKSYYSSSGSDMRLIPVLGMTSFDLEGEGTDDDFFEYKADQGGMGGLLLDIGSGAGAFQTGLVYLQTGPKASEHGLTVSVTLNYLAVPLLGKYNFSGDPSSTFFFKGGVTPMYFVDGKVKASYLGYNASQKIDRKEISSGDVMATAGFGFAAPMVGGNSFIVDATFNRGLVSVNKSGDDKIYNQGFLVSVGFGIDL